MVIGFDRFRETFRAFTGHLPRRCRESGKCSAWRLRDSNLKKYFFA